MLGLTALAVTKAALVAIFFMHLKFEGRWVYLLLVPATLLAVALVLAIYPDIASHPDQTRPAPTLAKPRLHVTARFSEQNTASRTEGADTDSRSNREMGTFRESEISPWRAYRAGDGFRRRLAVHVHSAASRRPGRSNQLENVFPPLPAFQLTERQRQGGHRPSTWREALDRARSCLPGARRAVPRITSVMKGLQEKLVDKDVQLVSFSVDPEHDTPEVLAEYADGYGADKRRWWFLTGEKDELYRLIKEGFKLSVEPLDPDDPQAAIMDISHSSKLALVDRGNRIVGLLRLGESGRATGADRAGGPAGTSLGGQAAGGECVAERAEHGAAGAGVRGHSPRPGAGPYRA